MNRCYEQYLLADVGLPKMEMVEAFKWVVKNIQYKSDLEGYGTEEFWNLPHLTIERGYGDCDDMAILLTSILLKSGYEAKMVVGSLYEQGHAWVEAYCPKRDTWYLLDPANKIIMKADQQERFGYYAVYNITPMGCRAETSHLLKRLAVAGGVLVGLVALFG